jgi:hypothetical protein
MRKLDPNIQVCLSPFLTSIENQFRDWDAWKRQLFKGVILDLEILPRQGDACAPKLGWGSQLG